MGKPTKNMNVDKNGESRQKQRKIDKKFESQQKRKN